jgi:ectoine hydroxylase-related dioxygenase (phytanoyl-CoA dioxygenase family)
MQFKPLTPEQSQFFEENGYLIIRDALAPDLLARVTEAVDRIYERGLAEEGLNKAGAYEKRDCIGMDDSFLDLLDYQETVPYVPQILTWDIQLDTSHIIVRPPSPPGTSAAFKAIGWHRDGGIATHEIPEPLPRLRMKICYLLSDLSEPGRGNTRFVPGSHLVVGYPERDEGEIDPKGTIEVTGKPGDAVIFENRLFHAVGPNLSAITRKTIFMGYSYRWLRPLDFVVQPPELMDKVKDNAVRWQLLGGWKSDMAFSLPKDEDVPLRAWYKEHGLDVRSQLDYEMDQMRPDDGIRRRQRIASLVTSRMDA